MRLKKAAALLLCAVMAVSTTACSGGTSGNTTGNTSGNTSGKKADKLVVWTLSEDLNAFVEEYKKKNEDVEFEVVIIPPADYPTKLTAALRGKSKTPDIIVGEPQMLPSFYEAGFFEDLTQDPFNAEQYKDQIVDYVYEAGKDENGVLRALSYQVTPGGMYYRRDIAQDVWGTEDPDFVSGKFKDFDAVLETANELREKGYRIFTDTGNLRWYSGFDGAWVKDGAVQITQSRMDYFHTAVELYQDKLVAFAPEWSAAWFASMSSPIPLNADWQELSEVDEGADKTEVFAYSLPSWGSLIIRDNAKENAGKFGVASGPCSYFGGGTFIGINSFSQNKEAAWDFVKFCTLDEETARWWTETSKGDVVSNVTVLEEMKDVENDTYGNQKTYGYFYDEAKKIDYSTVTKYDDRLKEFFGYAIESVQKGEKTEEEALKEFYSNVKSVYPDLIVPN